MEWVKLLVQLASPTIAIFALVVARSAKAVARRKPLDDFIVRLVVEEFESVLLDVDLFLQLCAPAAPDQRAAIREALNSEREKAFCRMRLLETVRGERSLALCRTRSSWPRKAWDPSLDTDSLELEPEQADKLKESHAALVKEYMAALRKHIEDIKSDR